MTSRKLGAVLLCVSAAVVWTGCGQERGDGKRVNELVASFQSAPSTGAYIALLQEGKRGRRALSQEYAYGDLPFERWLAFSFDVQTKFDVEERRLQTQFERHLFEQCLQDRGFRRDLAQQLLGWGLSGEDLVEFLASEEAGARWLGLEALRRESADLPEYDPDGSEERREAQVTAIRTFLKEQIGQ